MPRNGRAVKTISASLEQGLQHPGIRLVLALIMGYGSHWWIALLALAAIAVSACEPRPPKTAEAVISSDRELWMKPLALIALLAVLLAPLPAIAQDNLNTRERLDTFRRLDANGDSWVSKAEAAARREVAAGFQKADTNRDGRLSFAEFETIALNRSDQPGGYRAPERG